jgi:hypothetical protein
LSAFLTFSSALLAQPPVELLPKHMDHKTLRAIEKGLKYLAESQSDNGNWEGRPDGATYPCAMTALAGMAFLANGNTTSRGPYADNIRRAVGFCLAHSGDSGLIADAREMGQSMYGHGFSLLFLSCAYGMESKPKTRAEIGEVIKKAIVLTAQGQSDLGGWTYTPGGGDEGSVTVTQMQGLRAAHEAGFKVPKATIQAAIRYLELCQTPEGGICYSYASRGGTRLPISAAAVCCLYSAGEYESPLASRCLRYVSQQFQSRKGAFGQFTGHDYYCNLYAAQAFYQGGEQFWDDYFPTARDYFVSQQQPNGSWNGDGVGPTYGTAIALIILQLPYKFLPVYQR